MPSSSYQCCCLMLLYRCARPALCQLQLGPGSTPPAPGPPASCLLRRAPKPPPLHAGSDKQLGGGSWALTNALQSSWGRIKFWSPCPSACSPGSRLGSLGRAPQPGTDGRCGSMGRPAGSLCPPNLPPEALPASLTSAPIFPGNPGGREVLPCMDLSGSS